MLAGLVAVLAASGSVATAGGVGASTGFDTSHAACAAAAVRPPVGEQGPAAEPRSAAWLASGHHAGRGGALSPRPLKATLCARGAPPGEAAWVPAVQPAPGTSPSGATWAPVSRGPPSA